MTDVPQYLVVLATPKGEAVLQVPSLSGPDAAGRRAYWSAVTARWGDLDEVEVLSIQPCDLDGVPTT
jgi:hypothetical protein